MDFGFITKFASFFKPSSVVPDDDFADRLSHHVTCSLFMIFVVLVSGKTYVGQPLQCAVPHSFNDAMEQFAENYCFVQNTYFVAHSEEIPSSLGERDKRELTYYQWVPFVLALQALMFYIPCAVWRMLNNKSGIQVSTIIKLAMESRTTDLDERKKKVQGIVSFINDANASRGYLTILYLIVKVLYLVNVIGQFILMNSFLSSKWTTFYGFELITDLASGHEWHESGNFPRVTFCDFELRVIGNIQRHTIQCVLMINMFNEKIFIFLWWWCFFVAIVTFVSLVMWIYRTVLLSKRTQLVSQFLRMKRGMKKGVMNNTEVEHFTKTFLRNDGVLLIRILAGVGATTAYDIVDSLWEAFRKPETPTNRRDSSLNSQEHEMEYLDQKPESI